MLERTSARLLSLEQQDRDVAEIKVDEVFRFWDSLVEGRLTQDRGVRTMSDERAEVPADYAMPCGAFALVELGSGQYDPSTEMW